MNRKTVLFGNLVLLVGFAAGYAAAFFTAKKVEQLTQKPPIVITEPAASEDPTSTQQNAPAPGAVEDATDLAELQAHLLEKTTRINELERRLAGPGHETVPAEDDTPEYREKLAAELLEVTRTKDMIQQAFLASSQTLARELTPEGQEALNQAMKRIYGWDRMEKIFTKVYTDVFSAQELNDLAEFYRSDVGLAMLKKQPDLMQKTMQLVQQVNQEAQPKLKAEMDSILKKHRAQPASSATEPNPARN